MENGCIDIDSKFKRYCNFLGYWFSPQFFLLVFIQKTLIPILFLLYINSISGLITLKGLNKPHKKLDYNTNIYYFLMFLE